MNSIITVEGLRKYFGEVKAVDDINFTVQEGQLFAFLGPNGAGKSTTIDIICTFLQADSGSVSVGGFELGKDDDAIRNIIGAVFQGNTLDPLLTVEENLRTRAGFYGLRGSALDSAIEHAVAATDVSSFVNRPYGKLSGGQRRRSDIARALVHTPKILFLDEPTTGLDPQTRQSVWDTITALQRDTGMTVFLTTHYMEEAAEADFVVVIDEGKIAAKGTPAELREQYSSDALHLYSDTPDTLVALLTSKGIEHSASADRVTVRIEDSFAALPLVEATRDHIRSFEVAAGSMDEAFIGITGKDIRA